MSERLERIARTVLSLLGEAAPHVLPEDLYPYLSFTGAHVSKDFTFVDVGVQVAFGKEAQADEIFSRLLEYQHRLQKHIAVEIRLRRTPRLRLHRDKSLENSLQINDLLRRINKPEETEE